MSYRQPVTSKVPTRHRMMGDTP